jgi:quinol monooxygenase YgiN
MTITLVRYTVHPEHAEENAALVRDVYAELHADPPAGLRYATFRSDDGLGFVHFAVVDGEESAGPLTGVAAFRRFQEGVRDRCSEPPQVTRLQPVGEFRLLDA